MFILLLLIIIILWLGFKEFLNSDLLILRPNLVIWYCLVRAYSHTTQNLSQYDNVISRFGMWLDKSYHITLKSISFPFPEKHILIYFSHNGCYRKCGTDMGIFMATMKNDLTAFKIFCRVRHKPSPISDYTELEFLLLEYKYIQKYREPYFVILCQENKCQLFKMFN